MHFKLPKVASADLGTAVVPIESSRLVLSDFKLSNEHHCSYGPKEERVDEFDNYDLTIDGLAFSNNYKTYHS